MMNFIFSEEQALLRKEIKKCTEGKEVFRTDSIEEALANIGEESLFGAPFVVLQLSKMPSASDMKKLRAILEDGLVTICPVTEDVMSNSQYKELKTAGLVKYLFRPNSDQLADWIRNALGTSNSLTNLMVERSREVSVDEISKRIEVLSNFPKISIEEVNLIFPDTSKENVFALSNVVLRKDRKKAVQMLRKMLEGGEDALALIGILERSFRLSYKASTLEKDSIGKTIGLSPYQVKQLPNITKDAAAEGIRQCNLASKQIKIGRNPKEAVQMLVVSLTA